MRPGLLFSLMLICAVACGCSGVDYSQGHVEAVTLEPGDPAAGALSRIFVELYDPYLHPGDQNFHLHVTLQVTGGELEGQDWSSSLRSWETQTGQSIIVAADAAMWWTLPSEPGTYKLTVGYDGNTKTKRVEIK